ncbi:hypothetical protein BLNAU_11953 [Blattamonas nauphoetae]|uniref:Uncharacterized protein n=1 Tax=Blattamonas nauphoetae TaxID=2049346 RepID=A0ABQ9XL57_9EUKA|nr:hypothetical protein BLNAU_11953 [Blattamonas nauphoetae]
MSLTKNKSYTCNLPSPKPFITRYFKHRFVTDVSAKYCLDQYQFIHSNGLIVVGLAPTHPALLPPQYRLQYNVHPKTPEHFSNFEYLTQESYEGYSITKVDFGVGSANREQQTIRGKKKRGALFIEPNTVICHIHTSGGAVYSFHSCISGNLRGFLDSVRYLSPFEYLHHTTRHRHQKHISPFFEPSILAAAERRLAELPQEQPLEEAHATLQPQPPIDDSTHPNQPIKREESSSETTFDVVAASAFACPRTDCPTRLTHESLFQFFSNKGNKQWQKKWMNGLGMFESEKASG